MLRKITLYFFYFIFSFSIQSQTCYDPVRNDQLPYAISAWFSVVAVSLKKQKALDCVQALKWKAAFDPRYSYGIPVPAAPY